MAEQVDAVFQTRQSIVEFFNSAGWKIYKELVESLLMSEVCRKNKITQEAIDEKKLQELNFCLGKEKAYQTVLALKEELLEESEEVENSPSPA